MHNMQMFQHRPDEKNKEDCATKETKKYFKFNVNTKEAETRREGLCGVFLNKV